MSRSSSPSFTWRVTAALTTLAAGMVAEKVVATTWRAVTGSPAPKQEDLLDIPLAQVVLFAIVSGATAAVVRELSLRKAAGVYGRSGNNPLRPAIKA